MEEKKKKRKMNMKKYPYQTGKTTPWLDMLLPAKKPGYRTSKRGHRYYEARKNRSDKPGKRI